MPSSWGDTEKMVKRAESAGCPVLAWTIDTIGGRNTETATRVTKMDTRDCMGCHASHPITGSLVSRNRTRPMFAGLSGEMNPPEANCSYVDRLKKMTGMKLLLKGIDTAEDAVLAREHGADGVIVSNHGGRATDTGRGTMDILPEVIDAVAGRIPVFVDGGFRRGSDILKALAIGARAVGIGRPYIWGLASFGQEGVERVLEILRAELDLTMRQCGIASVAADHPGCRPQKWQPNCIAGVLVQVPLALRRVCSRITKMHMRNIFLLIGLSARILQPGTPLPAATSGGPASPPWPSPIPWTSIPPGANTS